jgi:hypothetical protein
MNINGRYMDDGRRRYAGSTRDSSTAVSHDCRFNHPLRGHCSTSSSGYIDALGMKCSRKPRRTRRCSTRRKKTSNQADDQIDEVQAKLSEPVRSNSRPALAPLLDSEIMTTFENGPAHDAKLMLRRSPYFLRVTYDGTKYDALDQLEDTPRNRTKRFTSTESRRYRAGVTSGPRRAVAARIRWGNYAYVSPQPPDAIGENARQRHGLAKTEMGSCGEFFRPRTSSTG